MYTAITAAGPAMDSEELLIDLAAQRTRRSNKLARCCQRQSEAQQQQWRGSTMKDNNDALHGEWECDECGFVHVGQSSKPPRTACPECGAEADSFTFYEYEDSDDWGDDGDDAWDD
jgi:rubrerythrin